MILPDFALKAAGPLLKAAVLITAVFFALLFTYKQGQAHTQGLWDLDRARLETELVKERARQAQVEIQVVTEYVDRVKTVIEKGKTIVKTVVEYVSVDSDNRCDVNCGFLRLYATSAGDLMPPATASLNDASSGVALSTVAADLSDNFTQCNAIREQLISLQQWASSISNR